ncbi:MAG: oligopeptide:H+ symporter [Myxococcota bacterium]|nr:oligopeptide:H+ symporter [Myxococcota bacterium]
MSSTTSPSATRPPTTKGRWPAGIPYIIGNEAAERFSFYGMKAILFVYLSSLFTHFQQLAESDPARIAAESRATHDVHLFVAGVYAFPMLGALIADRLFGKYNVIMWLSLVYCAGHLVLAIASPIGSIELFYLGLALIAIGSGGIKPCVSANVGDQFTKENQDLVSKVYQVFYFSINFGSFFSTLLTPVLYTAYGPDVAFGVPGILMAIATFMFWLGRRKFHRVPAKPGGTLGLIDVVASTMLFTPIAMFLFFEDWHWALRIGVSVAGVAVWYAMFTMRQRIREDGGFFGVLIYALRHQKERKPGQGFFDVARPKFGDDAEGPMAVIKIAVVFSMVSIFWALFDQHASSWVNQATRMYLPELPSWVPFVGGTQVQAAQISALNPVMVMAIIPFLNVAVYPVLKKFGIDPSPLRRMTIGMFMAAVAFVTVALLQRSIDAAEPGSVNVFWQIVPYLIMTTAEVLVSVTGLEFAYTQAPKAMKSTIMGFWLLTVSFGNKLVAVLAGLEDMPLEQFFWIFAVLMGIAAVIFAVLAHFYKGKTYLQDDEPAPESQHTITEGTAAGA